MANDELYDLIPSRRTDEKCWVVRASSGKFVKHFLDGEVIAIGHLDKGGLTDGAIDLAELDVHAVREILDAPLESGQRPARGTVTNQLNQVEDFLNRMSIDDLVLTLDARHVAVGRIIGPAYIDKTPVEIWDELRKSTTSCLFSCGVMLRGVPRSLDINCHTR